MPGRWSNAGNGNKRREPTQKWKRHLKLCCFQRDGWQEEIETEDGPKKVWFAHCAFGCGIILWLETATLDHFPIPYRLGGEWKVKNLRLACRKCNEEAGGPYGKFAYNMPQGLSNKEKIAWHVKHNYESACLNGMHGLPFDLM